MPAPKLPAPDWSDLAAEKQQTLARVYTDDGGRAAVRFAETLGIACTAAHVGALASGLRTDAIDRFNGMNPQASSDRLLIMAARAQARCVYRLEHIAKATGSYRAEAELSKACKNLADQVCDLTFISEVL